MFAKTVKTQYIGLAPVNDYHSPPFERWENSIFKTALEVGDGKLDGYFFFTPNHEHLFIVLPNRTMFSRFEISRAIQPPGKILHWDGNVTEPTIEGQLITFFESWYLIRGYLRKHP